MTTETKSTQTARIRAFNDELRKDFSQGHAVMTMGIAAPGGEVIMPLAPLSCHGKASNAGRWHERVTILAHQSKTTSAYRALPFRRLPRPP